MVLTRSANHLRVLGSHTRRTKHPRRAQPINYHVDDSDDTISHTDDESDDLDSTARKATLRSDTGSEHGSSFDSPPTRALRRTTIHASQRKTPSKPTRQSERTNTRRSDRSRRNSKRSVRARRGRSGVPETPLHTPKIELTRLAKRRRSVSHPSEVPKEVIPNWSSPGIPYQAWVDVFLYAASDGTTESLNTSWLRHAAITCYLFTEPALAVLYRNPYIKNANKARKLASTLEADPSLTAINYRTKIESLYLDVSIIPKTLYFPLIFAAPRLRELIIFTPLDQPPYRELDKNVRWTYSMDVFGALEPSEPGDTSDRPPVTALRSWEWSARLFGGSIYDMARIHQRSSFSRLTRLSFTNFQVPSLHMLPPKEGDEETALMQYEADGAVIQAIADAILELKFLKHLVFESSTVMNDRLLPLLPHNLTRLDLINCWEVKSDDLARFLCSHGRELEILNLLHNQSLDLAYLTDLAETCPSLREIHMNLSYYRHHESIDDGDPMYDQALTLDQIPKWPSTLRLIEFEHIRDWSVEAAEAFLQSLINQAERLPDLRHLVIKTILNISWQSRATMRREWRAKIDKVFRRAWQPPSECSTLRRDQKSPPDEDEDGSDNPRKKRRFRGSPPSRRSGRLALQGDVNRDNDDGIDVPFVQGLCEVVTIIIDNQKVRELQYGMEDFLRSGSDESEDEWNGDLDDDDTAIAF